ncbi:hypothetical protein EGN72_07420 [Pseudorhodobacter sp. E13]|uniref:hypothetical protein n=1 Tax=Pseudorhodobacter sp. E13 TaxID=2487931 RepID=UPI000F8E0DCB|nr:hypothetical protein [Pseudorhodobacter sp. E13]RUS60726.1 hypothetical protein EGN72_07420 [Pseudorhodobacter sp. E13]
MSSKIFSALALTALLAAPALANPTSPIKTAELSARLFAAGEAAADPILILSAAKLRKSINPTQTDRSAEGGEAAEGAPLGWEEMLARAEALAQGDAAVLGLIEDARAETTKGVVTGPVYNIGSLGSGRSDTYPKIEFKGGEYAEVYVEAKSSVDLNLTVQDAQGRLVCSDSDVSHIAYCGWRPAENGSYVLLVENKGKAATSYALMTN